MQKETKRLEPFGGKGDLTYGGLVDLERGKAAIREFMAAFGLDVESADMIETPRRVVEQYAELFSGLYHTPPKMTVFQNDIDHNELVLLRDIWFTSVCSHHFSIYSGKAHVAYVPKLKLSGLSKLARIVDYFAARPQLQERHAIQIADFLEAKLEPNGVAVHLVGSHSCVATRGAAKSGSSMVTTVLRGCFKTEARFRDNFFRALEV